MLCAVLGSFTGVRIGISTAKAFADALSIPVTGVTSLECLAYNLIDMKLLPSILFCSIIDAKNRNVYCGLYRYYNNCLNQITDLIAEDIDTVISKINTLVCSFNNQFTTIAFVGDGAVAYKELLQDKVDFKNLRFAEGEKNNANSLSIALAGNIKYNNSEYGDSSVLSPVYLRKSQAERALEGQL